MAIFFGITTLIFLIISIILYVYLRQTARYLFNLEDFISEMYNVVEVASIKIKRISEMPVAVDSPEIRFVTETITEISSLITSVSQRVHEIDSKKDTK